MERQTMKYRSSNKALTAIVLFPFPSPSWFFAATYGCSPSMGAGDACAVIAGERNSVSAQGNLSRCYLPNDSTDAIKRRKNTRNEIIMKGGR